MTTVAAHSAGGAARSAAVESADWRAAAIAMLSVRVIQGFIYWGGGSRRFIYDPSKLDPDAPSWMANKLQTAIPARFSGSIGRSPFSSIISGFYMRRFFCSAPSS